VSDTPDPRPRPAYGEYATPEEQRARIAQPTPEFAPPAAEPVAVPTPGVAPAAGAAAPAKAAVRPPVDRIATLTLLAMGAVNVFFSVQGFLDLGPTLARTMAEIGIPGEFTNVEAARTWGAIAAVVLLAGYLITALASWRRLSSGRRAWWIPIVGAAITYVLVVACLTVPIAGDPAFQAYVTSQT
jgi:energy-converting hydrogenase Eha subunit C